MIRILSTVQMPILMTLFAALLLQSCAALPKRGCAQHEPSETERQAAMEVVENFRIARKGNTTRTKNVVIDTYWHTITDGNNGQISKKVIDASIKVLNDAFAPDFSFNLVDEDTTKSIKFWEVDIDSNAEIDMKNELHKGDCGALNIYSTGLVSGLLGWATFPQWCKSDEMGDGVVIRYSTSPGVSTGPFSEGDTLTHEVGHWLGLYHTFEGGCSGGKSGGDQVADTPAVDSSNTGCPKNRDSCKNDGQGNDLVNNFMDYTDDSCMTAFTSGQRERMIAHWEKYRGSSAPKPPAINNKPTKKTTKKPSRNNKPTDKPTKKPSENNGPTKKPADKPTRNPTNNNGPTKKPTTDNKPTKFPSKPSGKCSKKEFEFKVVIKTDLYAGIDNNRFHLKKKRMKTGEYEQDKILFTKDLQDNKEQTFRKCLPKDECYIFTIKDDFGDGICCKNGRGWYKLYKNDVKLTKSKFKNSIKETVKFCGGAQQV